MLTLDLSMVTWLSERVLHFRVAKHNITGYYGLYIFHNIPLYVTILLTPGLLSLFTIQFPSKHDS